LPSDKPARRLEDIVENAQAIQRYTARMGEAAFREDQKTYDAVERCLERISEAAAKLGELAPTLVPGQPWQEIRALGNRLRHEYDEIREDRLWDIVRAICNAKSVSSKAIAMRSPGVFRRKNSSQISIAFAARWRQRTALICRDPSDPARSSGSK
jgi:uncharacterized protein with HEPN domain